MKIKKPQQKPAAGGRKQGLKSKEVQNIFSGRAIAIGAAVVFITAIVMSPVRDNQFLNSDDSLAYYSNRAVKDGNMKDAFTDEDGTGNWAPLTVISHIMEYRMDGGLHPVHDATANYARGLHDSNTIPNAQGEYDGHIPHTFSWLFHLATTASCFVFFLFLSNALASKIPLTQSGRIFAAGITALLFGIHPMHVENVAWIAARKDQFALFYFWAMTFYLLYLSRGNKKYLWFTGLAFVASLWFKAMAVTLPVALILIDLVIADKITLKSIWLSARSKVVFFLIAVVDGIVTIKVQHQFSAGNMVDLSGYSFIGRLAIPCFALVNYLYKTIWPGPLSLWHQYPLSSGGSNTWLLYASPLLLILFAGFLVWRKFWKNSVVLFGSAFFLLNLLLVLQILPVGAAIISERYTYLSYAGLFYIAAVYGVQYWERLQQPWKKKLATTAFTALMLVFAYTSYARAQQWHDNITFWRNEIRIDPQNAIAYQSLGSYYQNSENRDSTFIDSACFYYTKALNLRSPSFVSFIATTYVDRSSTHIQKGRLDMAADDLEKALKMDPKESIAWLHLGELWQHRKLPDSAIVCYSKVIALEPATSSLAGVAHFNRGSTLYYNKQSDAALRDLLDPSAGSLWQSYYFAALIYFDRKDSVTGMQALAKADRMMKGE